METEDFEREFLTEDIYIQESQLDKEHEFWAWYKSTEGRILVEQPDGSFKEEEETISDSRLPF